MSTSVFHTKTSSQLWNLQEPQTMLTKINPLPPQWPIAHLVSKSPKSSIWRKLSRKTPEWLSWNYFEISCNLWISCNRAMKRRSWFNNFARVCAFLISDFLKLLIWNSKIFCGFWRNFDGGLYFFWISSALESFLTE